MPHAQMTAKVTLAIKQLAAITGGVNTNFI